MHGVILQGRCEDHVISVHQSITITFIIFILNKFIQHQNVRDRGDKIVIWMITQLPVMFAIKNVFDTMKRGQRDTRCIVLWIHVSMLIKLKKWKSFKITIYLWAVSLSQFIFCSVCFYHSMFETELLKLSSISCLCFPLRLDKLWGVLRMIHFGFLRQTERFVSEYFLVNNYQGNKQRAQSNTHS